MRRPVKPFSGSWNDLFSACSKNLQMLGAGAAVPIMEGILVSLHLHLRAELILREWDSFSPLAAEKNFYVKRVRLRSLALRGTGSIGSGPGSPFKRALAMKIITDERCTGYHRAGHPERPQRISRSLEK